MCFRDQPLLEMLLLLVLWIPDSSVQAAASKCHEYKGLFTPKTIDAVMKRSGVDAANQCADTVCHVIRRKRGLEGLTLGCGACAGISLHNQLVCEDCSDSDGCNNAIQSLKSAKKTYEKCLQDSGPFQLANYDEGKEIYCTGGDTCQLLEYTENSIAQVAYKCSTECGQQSTGLIPGITITKACLDCELDSQAKPHFCKAPPTTPKPADGTQKPAGGTQKPAGGTSKPADGGDKSPASPPSSTLELVFLASTAAIVMLRAALL